MKFFEFFVGLRYLKSKKNQGFISFNTLLSIFIVFIGVFILILVISVLNGFQSQIKDKILDVDNHITIEKTNSAIHGYGIKEHKKLADRMRNIKHVKSVTPMVQGQGLFRLRSNISYVMIRGMGTHKKLTPEVRKFIVDRNGKPIFRKKVSKLEKVKRVAYRDRYGREFYGPAPYKNGIFIGYEMSKQYNLFIGDYVELIVPKGRLTAVTGVAPGLGRYRIRGFFKSGYYDFDTKLVLMSLNQAQRLFEIGDRVWGLGIKISDVFKMNEVKADIKYGLSFKYSVMTAEDKNLNLFYALKLEKLIMMIILFLVIISAGFTIMGTIVMVIMEKRKSIGVLKSMGAKMKSIMAIFILEGFFIGIIGSVLGVIFGVVTALNLEAIIRWIELSLNRTLSWAHTAFKMKGVYSEITLVPTHVYYIDKIPTEINIEFVVFVAIFAVFLSTVASIFPAWHAARMKPVETIRYE